MRQFGDRIVQSVITKRNAPAYQKRQQVLAKATAPRPQPVVRKPGFNIPVFSQARQKQAATEQAQSRTKQQRAKHAAATIRADIPVPTNRLVQTPPAVLPFQPPSQTEGPAQYQQAFQRNRPFASPGPYQTKLPPFQETKFRNWLNTNQVPFDVQDKTPDYDMRGFYKATGGNWRGGHFPDTFKTPYDTSFSKESQYATRKNPLIWRGPKLVDQRTGQTVFK